MYSHYNTNQTTLPLELSAFLPHNHLVFTIEKVVNKLDDNAFLNFYHEVGRPSYHPQLLLAALLFAYSQGIFFGRKIEKMMVENLALQYLTVMRLTPSSIDFWMVNSIFSPRDITWPR